MAVLAIKACGSINHIDVFSDDTLHRLAACGAFADGAVFHTLLYGEYSALGATITISHSTYLSQRLFAL